MLPSIKFSLNTVSSFTSIHQIGNVAQNITSRKAKFGWNWRSWRTWSRERGEDANPKDLDPAWCAVFLQRIQGSGSERGQSQMSWHPDVATPTGLKANPVKTMFSLSTGRCFVHLDPIAPMFGMNDSIVLLAWRKANHSWAMLGLLFGTRAPPSQIGLPLSSPQDPRIYLRFLSLFSNM